MSERDDKFDPNRPRSTPPARGRTREQVQDEEREPPSTEPHDEEDDDGLPRTAEIDREAEQEFDERRKSGRSTRSEGER